MVQIWYVVITPVHAYTRIIGMEHIVVSLYLNLVLFKFKKT